MSEKEENDLEEKQKQRCEILAEIIKEYEAEKAERDKSDEKEKEKENESDIIFEHFQEKIRRYKKVWKFEKSYMN
jgi:hypothetical protein